MERKKQLSLSGNLKSCCFRSKESLSGLEFDKTVNVETEKRDRYGRQIGKVLVNGRDVNLVQVERGMAWFYRQYQREQSPNDRRLYEAAEDAARAGKRGLWRDADPVPPWDFRHNRGAPVSLYCAWGSPGRWPIS